MKPTHIVGGGFVGPVYLQHKRRNFYWNIDIISTWYKRFVTILHSCLCLFNTHNYLADIKGNKWQHKKIIISLTQIFFKNVLKKA